MASKARRGLTPHSSGRVRNKVPIAAVGVRGSSIAKVDTLWLVNTALELDRGTIPEG